MRFVPSLSVCAMCNDDVDLNVLLRNSGPVGAAVVRWQKLYQSVAESETYTPITGMFSTTAVNALKRQVRQARSKLYDLRAFHSELRAQRRTCSPNSLNHKVCFPKTNFMI